MARPRTTRTTEATIADLREEFLDRCRAKNLSPRTIEWYEDRTRRFSDWCFERGILRAKDLTTDDLEAFVLSFQAGPYKPQAVRGFAQIAKTVARYGHRKGLIPKDLTRDFEMPKVPKTISRPSRTTNSKRSLTSPISGDGRGFATGRFSLPFWTRWLASPSWPG